MPKFLEVTDATAARAAIEASGHLYVNVRDYGAKGDGATDDTEAIEAAWTDSGTDAAIYFPPGNYLYNGTGLTNSSGGRIRLIGATNATTSITLGASSYFIDSAVNIASTLISGIAFREGKGAFRHTYTSSNVTGIHAVLNCAFINYTECAIASDSSDMPYWQIRDCTFNSANTTGTIAIALSSGNDVTVIESCLFQKNRIHIKARRGNNLHISKCEMIPWNPDNSSGARAAVWVVPSASITNSGSGMTITGGRFGNEALQSGDFRVLVADELSGASNGVRMPQLAADSTGFVSGVNITQNFFAGTSGVNTPIIYSTTPNISYFQVHHNVVVGTPPSYMVEFRTPPTTPNRLNSISVFGPFTGDIGTEASLPFPVSNAEGVGFVNDPIGLLQRSASVRNWASGSSASYKEILSAGITSFTAQLVTKSNITDALGGSDAITLTMDNVSGIISSALTTDLVPGLPLWVEFDVANPDDGNAASKFYVGVRDDPSTFHIRRCVEVPPVDKGWVTYAFCFTPRNTGQVPTRLIFTPVDADGVGKTVNIGRPRVYHANERQLGGRRPSIEAAVTSQADTADLVNDIRNQLIGLGLVAGTPSSGSVSAGTADVQLFTASGTWTKPAGAVSVHVCCIGPGGGGGSGARGASGTALGGGAGGGGGGISQLSIDADDLPSTVSVTVGTGGGGGAARTTDDTAGAAGSTPSNHTTFGTYVQGSRGGAGAGGGIAASAAAGAGGVGLVSGAAGGGGSASGGAGGTGSSSGSAGGGGGGGGVTTAPAATAGGNGGSTLFYPVTTVGGNGASGSTGSVSAVRGPGGGGSGGGGNASSAGHGGGSGGTYGGGGGGGGASLNGNNSGAGGSGGNGICVVTTYF